MNMKTSYFAAFSFSGLIAMAACANAVTLPTVVEDGTTFHADSLYVIANTNDGTSTFLAQQYMKMRGIPPQNLIQVALPVKIELTAAEAAPLKAAVDQAAGAKHFAIAWSMPYRVGPHQSITSYVSLGYLDPNKYFTKICNENLPTNPYRHIGDAGSPDLKPGVGMGPVFDSGDNGFGYTNNYKPVTGFKPSMLLASFTSTRLENGKVVVRDPVQSASVPGGAHIYSEGALATASRGKLSDNKWYGGTLYLLKTSDPRRNTRAYAMESALSRYGSHVGIQYLQQEMLTDKKDILVYMTGATQAYPFGSTDGTRTNNYLNGAVADTLTSYSGRLYDTLDGQMSILDFLKAGATASYGTVREPCNYSAKFPNPDTYTRRLLSGDNLIEAYWKSVLWPAEGLFIGEPLARPYNRMKVDYDNGMITVLNRTELNGYYDIFVDGQLVRPRQFLKYKQPIQFPWSGAVAVPKVRIVLKQAANFSTT